MLKYAILGHLSYQPMFGYEIKHIMDRCTSYFWHAKLSQIYMTLKTLEKEKALTSDIENQDDKPDRRRYTITDAGRKDLEIWLRKPRSEIPQNKDELLLRLFFSANVNKAELLSELHLQKRLHQDQLYTYQNETAKEIEDSRIQNPGLAKDAILWEATRRMGEYYEKAYIEWLNETIQKIELKF